MASDQTPFWASWLLTPFMGSEDDETADPDADNSTGDGGGDDTSSGTEPDTQEEKTLTQTEVNALISREKAKITRGMVSPKELGFTSKQDLADFLQKMKGKEEADKTESEKEIEARVKAAEDEARNSVLSKANSRLIKSEFVIAASKAGVVIPMDDAFQVAQGLESYEAVVDEETGNVSGFGDDFFTEFKKVKPYVFAKAGAPDIGAGAGGGGADKGKVKEDELRQNYPSLGRAMSATESAGIRTR